METKPWWQSKTVWASALAILLSLLAVLNVDHIGEVQVENVQANQEALLEWVIEVATAIAGGIALWGRLTAKARIGG